MHTGGRRGGNGVDSPQKLNIFLLPLGLKCKRRLWNTTKKKKLLRDFISSPVVRTLYFHCRGMGLIPGFGRSPGEGKGYPLQYSGLGNSMDYSPWGCKGSDMTE